MIETMKLSKYLSNQQKNSDVTKTTKLFLELKDKIDIVKYKSRKVKSLTNTNNTLQEMDRLFLILRQNLNESFKNQVILKDDLVSLQKSKKRVDRRKVMQTMLRAQNMQQPLN